MAFYVYILECADGTLYTGSTNDLEKRLYTHNHLKNGARYTRARRPVSLVYHEFFETLSEARRREHNIKLLRRSEKIFLIQRLNGG